jgi:hypothetical protein
LRFGIIKFNKWVADAKRDFLRLALALTIWKNKNLIVGRERQKGFLRGGDFLMDCYRE